MDVFYHVSITRCSVLRTLRCCFFFALRLLLLGSTSQLKKTLVLICQFSPTTDAFRSACRIIASFPRSLCPVASLPLLFLPNVGLLLPPPPHPPLSSPLIPSQPPYRHPSPPSFIHSWPAAEQLLLPHRPLMNQDTDGGDQEVWGHNCATDTWRYIKTLVPLYDFI